MPVFWPGIEYTVANEFIPLSQFDACHVENLWPAVAGRPDGRSFCRASLNLQACLCQLVASFAGVPWPTLCKTSRPVRLRQ